MDKRDTTSSPTMTKNDWETIQELQTLESELCKRLLMPMNKAARDQLRKYAQKYASLVKDPKVARVIELCFGDSPDDEIGIVESKRRFGKEVMAKVKK